MRAARLQGIGDLRVEELPPPPSPGAGEQPEAVRLLPVLAPRLARLISAPIDLDAVPAAYQALIEGRAPALKTIIRP
jgi:hypothetical protein